jgi:hypothetical protein
LNHGTQEFTAFRDTLGVERLTVGIGQHLDENLGADHSTALRTTHDAVHHQANLPLGELQTILGVWCGWVCTHISETSKGSAEYTQKTHTSLNTTVIQTPLFAYLLNVVLVLIELWCSSANGSVLTVLIFGLLFGFLAASHCADLSRPLTVEKKKHKNTQIGNRVEKRTQRKVQERMKERKKEREIHTYIDKQTQPKVEGKG